MHSTIGRDYWVEAIESSLAEHGVIASPEQIIAIASDVEVAHENYDMAFGYDVASKNLSTNREDEIVRLKAELREAQSRVVCRACSGRGLILYSRCGKCHGAGWL
jgi:hypothetical protein